LEADLVRRVWVVMVSWVARSLEVVDDGLPLEERLLLRHHTRLVWATALGVYAAGTLLALLIDPPTDGLWRWVLPRLITLVVLVLSVAVVRRIVFSQRIARLREDKQALRVRADQDRETDLFVKSVTHDLRSPLTTIKAYAQMLQRQSIQQPGLGAKGLQRIEVAASRAASMLDELSDVPQLQAGRALELRYEPVDLLALVREVLGEYEQITAQHALRLETSLSTLVGEWDRPRIARVLGNLLSNAVKYSPSGGRIVVRVQRTEQSDGPWATVSVCDEGVGISEADIRHVFEPFFRGTHAAGPIEGSGIGLASARGIVEQHGGTISAESQPEVGSTFTVRLPLQPRAVEGVVTYDAARSVELAAPAPVAHSAPSSSPRAWSLPGPAALVLLGATLLLVLGSGGLFVRLQAEAATRRQVEDLLAHAQARPLEAAAGLGSAGGRAYVDAASDQVLLVVSQMPTLPTDRAYQLWFVRPDGQRDSGGMVRVDAQGEGTILARAPAGLPAYSAIGVTEEPASGSLQPSGPRVVGAALSDQT
jgi:signal transduction histidine kinase